MDIRSRKSSKIAKLIIALTVVLPALLLVSLYPRMEKLMREKRAEYEEEYLQITANLVEEDVGYNAADSQVVEVSLDTVSTDSTNGDYASLTHNSINYAVDASYY